MYVLRTCLFSRPLDFSFRDKCSGAPLNENIRLYRRAMRPVGRLAEIRRVPQISTLLLFRLREIRSGASPNMKSAFLPSHEPRWAIGGNPTRAANFDSFAISLARDSLRRLAGGGLHRLKICHRRLCAAF